MIYATIPFARAIQKFVTYHFGSREVFTAVVLAAIVAGAGLVSLHLVKRRDRIRWYNLACLLAVAAVYAFYAVHLKRKSPEEALHFIEYGVLGILLFRALNHRARDPLVFVAAALVGATIGTLDEVVQWVTPQRYWDWRDVWLNTVSCGLMQVAIAGGYRPDGVRAAVSAPTVRTLARCSIALLVLLALCASNTPRRVEWYASRLPALDALRRNESVMAEYGYRHVDPAIGAFYSRLSRRALRGEDANRADEAARILGDWRSHGSYSRFLQTYPPGVDPFVHEARVHLFRRDHHLWTLRRSLDDPDTAAYHATVVDRENALVAKYYSNAVTRAGLLLDDQQLSFVRTYADGTADYESPVSKNVITRFTETQVRTILLILVGAVICCSRLWQTRMERSTRAKRPDDETRQPTGKT